MKHKVLFLASWYPSKILPLSGIFVKRHAEAVANFCDVAVLHVIQDPNLNDKKIEIETENEKNVFTVRVFYKDNEGSKSIISRVTKMIRRFKAEYTGFKTVNEKFGKPNIIHVNVLESTGLFTLFLNFFN